MPKVAIGPKFERREFAKPGLYAIFETPAPSVTIAVLGDVAFENSNNFPQPFGQSNAVTFVKSAFAPALGGMSAIGSYGVAGPSVQSNWARACDDNSDDNSKAAIESSEARNILFMTNLRNRGISPHRAPST